jgi:sugar phosphate isomerase/epimerase
MYTRRELARLMLTAVPLAGMLPKPRLAAQSRAKPDSRFAGVQVGMNVPYNFGTRTMSADETLDRCLQLGVSAVELRSQPVEQFLGAPAGEPVKAWRATAPVEKARAFRTKYEDAGVRIEIVKFDDLYKYSDAELDYAFSLAKALGARAISCEIDVEGTRRVGRFADKHGVMVGYHGHTAATPAMWETAFGYAAHNGANLDIGHFVAGFSTSPVPFLKAHHDRITHVHIKDRKAHDGATVPFGEGDTPIVEVLHLMRDNKWNMQATIEFEYPVPPGSDRMAEMAKCIQYCKNALLS